jgi:hypothetical protein
MGIKYFASATIPLMSSISTYEHILLANDYANNSKVSPDLAVEIFDKLGCSSYLNDKISSANNRVKFLTMMILCCIHNPIIIVDMPSAILDGEDDSSFLDSVIDEIGAFCGDIYIYDLESNSSWYGSKYE